MNTQNHSLNSSCDINAFREHKHNYKRLFRNVISDPARVIMEEFIKNPEYFTLEERSQILRIYTNSIELRGTYNMLGKPFEEQISEKQLSIIPQINDITDFFRDIYSQNREFAPLTPHFNKKLAKSLEASNRFCQLLETMELPGYGTSSVFNLRKIVDEEFRKDQDEYSGEGYHMSYQYESFCGELSTLKVSMNEEGFRIHVLNNLIDNLHKRAFLDFEPDTTITPKTKNNEVLEYEKLSIFYSLYKSFIGRLKNIFCSSAKLPNSGEETFEESRKEKKVLMKIEKDISNSDRINLFIMNNGEPFKGNTETVFDWGIGNGSGIGLSSARSFLKEYDATIKMVTDNNTEYKVCFIINIPVYENK